MPAESSHQSGSKERRRGALLSARECPQHCEDEREQKKRHCRRG